MTQIFSFARVLICVLCVAIGSAFAGHSTPQPGPPDPPKTATVVAPFQQVGPISDPQLPIDPTGENDALNYEISIMMLSTLLGLIW